MRVVLPVRECRVVLPVRERRVVPITAIVIGFRRPALSLYAPSRITETMDGPMFISNSKMFQKAT